MDDSGLHSKRSRASVLVISCYELGQQPLGTAIPAGVLARAGYKPRQLDLAVEPLDEKTVRKADLVAISVPMHTALRIGIEAAKRVRGLNSRCHIAFFGIYAALNAEHLLETVADSCLGAEAEDGLVDLAARISHRETIDSPKTTPDWHAELERGRARRHSLPYRNGLPDLHHYVKLIHDGERRTVGAVITTRGCKHLCRHCPIPTVYGGRFYALAVDDIMEDIRGLVANGARHITFADADFLNGPTHALRVARSLHDGFPHLTFDFTAKVEHLLREARLLPDLKALGCLFVVSAVESISNATLTALRKGHSADDARRLFDLFRTIGLTLRPTFVPFTPWDTLADYSRLLSVLDSEGLVDQVDPVQLSIRLLVPPGSLLADADEMRPSLTGLDKQSLSWRWRHPDPRMDRLHAHAAACVEDASRRGEDPLETFARLRTLARGAEGSPHVDPAPTSTKQRVKPPRLSEDWFC